jgi:hypothetical protein
MDPPASLLDVVTPSETALLDFARAPSRVSREMIHEIAKNDRENNVAEYELGILKQLTPKARTRVTHLDIHRRGALVAAGQ